MSTAVEKKLTTLEEFLALPDDGIERWLINGVVREFGDAMTRRNRHHCRLTARLAQLIGVWLDGQPTPRGEVYDGEVGCILRRDPYVTVGIDLAFVSAEIAAATPDDTEMIDGVPTLVAEVISPNDDAAGVREKIDTYLEASVPLVWIIDPYDRAIRVYRPGEEMESFNVTQEITAEPHLPGFRVRVASIFSR